MTRPNGHGFTLVELLVVITIIVILLALLMPAMDQAIYQAELAVCGSKLHTIASGSIMYAHANKRRYPDRPSIRANGNCRPIELYWGGNGPTVRELDDRRILGQFLDVNETLNCPLVKEIDIEGSDPDTTVISPYGLYFSFQYKIKDLPPDKGMFRLGDRLTYTDYGNGAGPAAVYSSNVLASDWDSIYTNNLVTYATHPDLGGVMEPYYYQDQDWTETSPIAVGPTKATWSYWITVDRPAIDTNYAFDDGSVRRYNRVEWSEGNPAKTSGDRRLTWMPQHNVNPNVNWRFHLPTQ